MVRRRLDRRAPALQRSPGSRLRFQPRARRADHGRAGRGHLSLRARQHRRAIRAPPTARAGRLDDHRDAVGCQALDRSAPAGTRGTPLRLCAMVSQGRGLRPVRLGGTPALSGWGVLWRVRHLSGRPRRTRGRGHGRNGRAGVRGPRLGTRQSQSETAGRVPARLLRRPHALDRCVRGSRLGAKEDPMVCGAGAPLRHVAESRVSV